MTADRVRAWLRRASQKIGDTHQVVGCRGEGEHPAHPNGAAMTGLAQSGDGFDPAKHPGFNWSSQRCVNRRQDLTRRHVGLRLSWREPSLVILLFDHGDHSLAPTKISAGVAGAGAVHDAAQRHRPAGAQRQCAGHVQRPGGESPLCNLMEVKHE